MLRHLASLFLAFPAQAQDVASFSGTGCILIQVNEAEVRADIALIGVKGKRLTYAQ